MSGGLRDEMGGRPSRLLTQAFDSGVFAARVAREQHSYSGAPPGVPAVPQAEVREAGSGGCDQAQWGFGGWPHEERRSIICDFVWWSLNL